MIQYIMKHNDVYIMMHMYNDTRIRKMLCIYIYKYISGYVNVNAN